MHAKDQMTDAKATGSFLHQIFAFLEVLANKINSFIIV